MRRYREPADGRRDAIAIEVESRQIGGDDRRFGIHLHPVDDREEVRLPQPNARTAAASTRVTGSSASAPRYSPESRPRQASRRGSLSAHGPSSSAMSSTMRQNA